MTRRMSCSMTIDAVRDQTKTVTRRHVNTWKTLQPGDRLTLIEKGMGLPKGAKQVVICEVEVTDVRVEAVGEVLLEDEATDREGLGHMDPIEFAIFWCRSHHVPIGSMAAVYRTPCRRIEWKYLP